MAHDRGQDRKHGAGGKVTGIEGGILIWFHNHAKT
jgi:hypothetical protein